VSRSWRILGAFLFVLAPVVLVPATASAVVEWVPPTQISTGGQDASGPHVASGNGTAVAVWQRSDGSNLRVQAAVRPSGGNFGAPATLSDPGQDAFKSAVAMDPAGNALAVWERFDGGSPNRPRVQASWRPAGGSFGAPQTLSTAGVDTDAPQVSLDSSGTATVVWVSGATGNLRIQASRAASLGTFGAPQTISDAGNDAFDPDVADEGSGGAVAVWTRFDGANLRTEATDRRDVIPGYETPASDGALAASVSLVPIFKQCAIGSNPANGQHSAPLSGGACLPPGTLGTAHVGSQSVGTAAITSLAGDMGYTANITDVRATSKTGPDYNPNASGPDMGMDSRFRMSDMNSCSGLLCSGPYTSGATATDISFPVAVDCVGTSDPGIGSTCNVATSADAVNPSMVRVAKHTVVSLFRIIVRDAGPDGVRGNSDDKQFEQQGFFVP